MIRLLNRALFSLNLGFGIALPLTVLGLRQSMGFHDESPLASPGLFQQFVIAANHATNYVPWASNGADIALLSLTAVLSLMLLIISRILAETVAFRWLSGVFALTAVPLAWLLVALTEEQAVAIGWAVILEFALLGGFLQLTRTKLAPFWFIALGAHYFAYICFAWQFTGESLIVPFTWRVSIILSFIAPCTGYVWLAHLKQIRRTLSQPRLLA